MGLKFGISVAALIIPIQILVGDMHGLNTLEHQPQKIAAMEGNWDTQPGIPLILFALPNEEKRKNDFEIGIPKISSLILTHKLDGEVRGLNDFIGEHPPVSPVFWGFRIMVGMGLLMLLVSWTAAYLIFRKKQIPIFLKKILIAMTFSGWIATLAGWYTTEIGRQPYLVSGILRVEDAVTNTPASHIGFSLIGYLIIYSILLFAFITTIFYLAGKENAGLNTAIDPKTGQRRNLVAS